MAKAKEGKDDEFYKGEIRALKAENKALKQRLRQLEKKEHLYLDNKMDEEEPPIFEEIRVSFCPKCDRGHLTSTDLGIKTLLTCSSCDYRKVRNK